MVLPVVNVGPDGSSTAAYPLSAVKVYTSGSVAAATATCTVAKAAGKYTYLLGFCITGGGATSAAIKTLTITGCQGGTFTMHVPVPAGATVGLTPLNVQLPAPLPSSAVNTDIVLSLESLGTGAAAVIVTAFGFTQEP